MSTRFSSFLLLYFTGSGKGYKHTIFIVTSLISKLPHNFIIDLFLFARSKAKTFRALTQSSEYYPSVPSSSVFRTITNHHRYTNQLVHLKTSPVVRCLLYCTWCTCVGWCSCDGWCTCDGLPVMVRKTEEEGTEGQYSLLYVRAQKNMPLFHKFAKYLKLSTSF